MKKVLVLVFIIIACILHVVFFIIACSLLVVIHNQKQVNEPSIYMPYVIDTVDFKSNMESESYISKHFVLLNNESEIIDTFDVASFNEKCYIQVAVDTLNLSSVCFDTGSDPSIFDINIIPSKRSGKERALTNMSGFQIPNEEIYVDKVILGKTELKSNNVPFLGNSLPKNTIGGDILKYFVWKIDNHRRKIYFSRDTSAFIYEDCIAAVPFILINNRPFAKCKVNGSSYDVMLDTGFAGFLHIVDSTSVNKSLLSSYIEPRDSFIFTTSIDDSIRNYSDYGVNYSTRKDFRTISDVKIESISLNNEVIIHNLLTLNILGWDFFQRFEYVIFDYLNLIMYLGPINEFKSFSYVRNLRRYVNTIGFHSIFLKDHCIINSITDSLKEKGLSLGDTIIAIDGTPFSELELLKAIYSKDSVKITIKNGDIESDYKLYREYYISEPDTVITYGEISIIPIYKNRQISSKKSEVRINRYFN